MISVNQYLSGRNKRYMYISTISFEDSPIYKQLSDIHTSKLSDIQAKQKKKKKKKKKKKVPNLVPIALSHMDFPLL